MLDLIGALLLVSAQNAEPASAPAQSDPIVCKKGKVPHVGTRLRSTRECKPKSEWDAEAKQTQHELRQIQERATNPTPVAPR